MASQHQTLNDTGKVADKNIFLNPTQTLCICKQRQKLANISLTFDVLRAYRLFRLLDNKEKDTAFPQNVNKYLPVSTEQHPRRLYSSNMPSL
jgi:hypothetical protein